MAIDVASLQDDELRNLLVKVSLEWEKRFSVAPHITSDIAEYAAAKLLGTRQCIGRL